MDRGQNVDGLELHDELIGDQEVEAPFADAVTLVRDRNGNLAPIPHVPQLELDAWRVLVNRFEETWSECLVHFDRGGDDLGCNPIELSARFPQSRWRPGVLALHTSKFGRVA